MHGTVAGKLAVAGTHKSVVQILALHKAAAVGQLRAAVGAVEKPGQTVWGGLRGFFKLCVNLLSGVE